MSLAFLFNVPIKTKFQVAGTKNTKDLLEAFLGDFIPGEAEGVILELDATITQNHVLTSEVTEHPLDDNTSFSDHIILRPRQLSIEGTITDTPVQFLSVFQTGTIGNIFGGKLQPSLESWQTLVNELWYSRTPFDIVTSKDFYKNVVPISISSARNNKTGRQNRFMMEVKQLSIMESDKKFNPNSILATDEELGYLSNQVPDVTTIVQAALFVSQVVYQLAT